MLAHMVLAPDNRVTYIGRTNHRGSDQLFGIRLADRRLHILITGKTGTGKTHLLRLLIEQLIQRGEGCALFDPHGDLAAALHSGIGKGATDFVYIDPADAQSPWRFNPFAGVPADDRSRAANGIVDVFKKLWLDDWGPRLEHLLRNAAFALLETDGATFGDLPRLLTNRAYRLELAHGLTNSAVRDFWCEEFDKYPPAFRSTVIAPLQNKVGAFLTDPVLRRFLTEDGRLIDVREILDSGNVLIANLDKGRLGEGSASVLGSLLLSHIALAGLARSAIAERDRRDFAVFVDEFQTFTTQALANMLSELRKYRVSMVLATQYLAAIDSDIRDAAFGNIGTLISFRVGASDAAYLARELGSPVSLEDLTGLPRHSVYVRLLIDGEPSRPFSAAIPPHLVKTGDATSTDAPRLQ